MNDIVGKKFESKNFGWFTVGTATKKVGQRTFYEVIFDEHNGVIYKVFSLKHNILKKSIKNPYYRSFYEVGFLGDAKQSDHPTIYNRWDGLLKRCYSPKHKGYKSYGGKGVIVCERWLCFENFLQDYKHIENYDESNLHNLTLDKDIKFPGNKIYSLENCILVTRKENTDDMIQRNCKKFKAISPDGAIYEGLSQNKFAKQHDLQQGHIGKCLNGKMKHHKKWTFQYL